MAGDEIDTFLRKIGEGEFHDRVNLRAALGVWGESFGKLDEQRTISMGGNFYQNSDDGRSFEKKKLFRLAVYQFYKQGLEFSVETWRMIRAFHDKDKENADYFVDRRRYPGQILMELFYNVANLDAKDYYTRGFVGTRAATTQGRLIQQSEHFERFIKEVLQMTTSSSFKIIEAVDDDRYREKGADGKTTARAKRTSELAKAIKEFLNLPVCREAVRKAINGRMRPNPTFELRDDDFLSNTIRDAKIYAVEKFGGGIGGCVLTDGFIFSYNALAFTDGDPRFLASALTLGIHEFGHLAHRLNFFNFGHRSVNSLLPPGEENRRDTLVPSIHLEIGRQTEIELFTDQVEWELVKSEQAATDFIERAKTPGQRAPLYPNLTALLAHNLVRRECPTFAFSGFLVVPRPHLGPL